MYKTQVLDAESTSFINFLAGPRASKLSALIAIAKALSDSLALPSGQLQIDMVGIPLDPAKKLNEEQQTIRRFFRSNHEIALKEKLSSLNEVVVLDCEKIIDYVVRLYTARYYMVYPTGMIFCIKPETAVLDFFGLGIYLGAEEVKAISENGLELTRVYNGAVKFFARMSEEVR